MNSNDFKSKWAELEDRFSQKFGKEPDLETILMLIGIQELRNSQQKFNKDEKEDLMHIAVCTVLSQGGFYKLKEYDKEGWPHFEKDKPMPAYNIKEQEDLLREHVLLYFEKQGNELPAS